MDRATTIEEVLDLVQDDVDPFRVCSTTLTLHHIASTDHLPIQELKQEFLSHENHNILIKIIKFAQIPLFHGNDTFPGPRRVRTDRGQDPADGPRPHAGNAHPAETGPVSPPAPINLVKIPGNDLVNSRSQAQSIFNNIKFAFNIAFYNHV